MRSTSSTSSARSKIGVGHRLAHAHLRDLRDDVVQALDVLDVDGRVDVDAAARAAPRRRDSAWGGGCPARWCGRARRPARAAGAARGCASRSISSSTLALVVDACGAGMTSRPSSSASVSLRPCVSTTPTTTSTPSCLAGARPAAASRRSCRRRAPRRGRSSACRAALLASRRFEQGLGRGPLFGITPLIRHQCSWLVELPRAHRPSPIEREVERQHIDPRLAENPEQAALDVLVDELRARRSSGKSRALATRGTWK